MISLGEVFVVEGFCWLVSIWLEGGIVSCPVID